MSSTLELWHQLDIQGDPSLVIGNRASPVLLTVANGQAVYSDNISVADNYGVSTLWSTGGGGASDFLWGVLVPTKDVLVQLKNDKGSPEYIVALARANLPFYFGYNTRGGTSAFLSNTVQTTALGNITEIKVQNNVASGQGAAVVDFVLFR